MTATFKSSSMHQWKLNGMTLSSSDTKCQIEGNNWYLWSKAKCCRWLPVTASGCHWQMQLDECNLIAICCDRSQLLDKLDVAFHIRCINEILIPGYQMSRFEATQKIKVSETLWETYRSYVVNAVGIAEKIAIPIRFVTNNCRITMFNG